MNEEAKIFAKNLRKLMVFYGDTQTSLEKRSGVSQKTISNMLNPGDDRSPILSNIGLVAAAYKLKAWHMLIPDAPIDAISDMTIDTAINNQQSDKKRQNSTSLHPDFVSKTYQ